MSKFNENIEKVALEVIKYLVQMREVFEVDFSPSSSSCYIICRGKKLRISDHEPSDDDNSDAFVIVPLKIDLTQVIDKYASCIYSTKFDKVYM